MDDSVLNESCGDHADTDQVSSGTREKTVASVSCLFQPPARKMWWRDMG